MLAETPVEMETLLELDAGAPDPDPDPEVRPFYEVKNFAKCIRK